MPDKRIISHNPDRHPQKMKNQTHGEPVGWCSHNKHRGKLSVRQMKNHECLKKQCRFFTKNEAHSYWAERESRKQKKKAKKAQDMAVTTMCEHCEYMYHLRPKPEQEEYAKYTVRYCGYEDAGKIRHYYCSTKNPNNRCSHFKERIEEDVRDQTNN